MQNVRICRRILVLRLATDWVLELNFELGRILRFALVSCAGEDIVA